MSGWTMTTGTLLLLAASLFSQKLVAPDPQPGENGPSWFSLDETRDEIRSQMGPPKMVADFGPGLQSWQYRFGNADHDEFSHVLVFRKSDGALISVARNYTPERNVDWMFPPSKTTVHSHRQNGQPAYHIRLRKLPGGRVLIATGTSKAGQPTGQIVLARESELHQLYPWLSL